METLDKRSNPIIVTQDFEAPVQVVWIAITEHEQMIQWYFENIPSFEPKVGFSTQFIIENEGRTFTHLWTVTDVKERSSITYDWHFKEYSGKGKVTFALEYKNGLTTLTLTNEGLDSFLKHDIPEFTRESCLGGWNYFIKERLKAFLDQ